MQRCIRQSDEVSSAEGPTPFLYIGLGLVRRGLKGHEKAGCSFPRHPASTHIHLYEAGLSPSRRTSVMAQMFSPIHELTGALTQGRWGGARLLRPRDTLGEGSLTQLVAAFINCQPERVDK